MMDILKTYLEYRDWIDLIKDIFFIFSSLAIFRAIYLYVHYIKKREYLEKSVEIEKNLTLREGLGNALEEYIGEKKTGGISIRFVFWKNYPENLQNDAYKFFLHINYLDNRPHYGWIDNTGVNFEESVWYFGNSIYIDKNGIFFSDKKGQKHKGFEEILDPVLVLHMPFSNIVNYDFIDRVEYEPVFYIKYKYTKWRRLYDDNIVLREKFGEKYKKIPLKQSKMIINPSKKSIFLMKTKIFILRFLKSNK